MPKSVVELTTSTGAHVAWVEIRASDRPRPASLPVMLLWGLRYFVWTTVNEQSFHVFTEATTIVSHTPSPGLARPEDLAPIPLSEQP